MRVVIVGAGFAGLGAAVQLARQGHDFLVLERSAEVGGTWRDNVYPGVGCDIPSHLYSFSFAPKPNWPRRFAAGHQIQQYLTECAYNPELGAPGLSERILTRTELHRAAWDDSAGRWQLHTNRGVFTASVLVPAGGRFTQPFTPKLPGVESFPGPVCHTARWDPSISEARRVGVVGTGASAVQVVPALVSRGTEVVVFQRRAPWIVPKGDAAYSQAERKLFSADAAARRAHRDQLFAELDAGFQARVLGTERHRDLHQRALQHLHRQVADPDLRDRLTPNYTIGCKRVLLSDEFYPALNNGTAVLEPSAPRAVDGTQITAVSGASYQLEALVFATGFDASIPPIAKRITGRRHRSLAEHWATGMTSFASTAVTGFPNCFLLGGPNSALGHNSAVTMMETQYEHLLSALQALPEGVVAEASPQAEENYTEMINSRAERTAWMSQGCSSWYRDRRTGRLTLLWPGTAAEYASRFARFAPEAYCIKDQRPTAVSTISAPGALA